jgi:tRNA dimethylallyltransferase
VTTVDKPPKAVLIAGPTASGKSALALAVARRLDGVIVNIDSMQVYRDLHIITARPSAAEERELPHRLYGHVDAAENYSVARYLADAAPVLAEAAAAGKLPVFVGGTGLYFKALTQGLSRIPPVQSALRETIRRRISTEGAAAMHAELARRDPQLAARITPADRTRIARGLEVIEATGRSLDAWNKDNSAPLIAPAHAVRLFLDVPRAELVARIDRRFGAMLAAGALDEVRALAARGLDPLLPAMKAHGVPWLIRHLNGEITLEEAAAQAKRDTRHYAKRQGTWFRHQLADWTRVAPEAGLDEVVRALVR